MNKPELEKQFAEKILYVEKMIETPIFYDILLFKMVS